MDINFDKIKKEKDLKSIKDEDLMELARVFQVNILPEDERKDVEAKVFDMIDASRKDGTYDNILSVLNEESGDDEEEAPAENIQQPKANNSAAALTENDTTADEIDPKAKMVTLKYIKKGELTYRKRRWTKNAKHTVEAREAKELKSKFPKRFLIIAS
jgi:hypothetical protein